MISCGKKAEPEYKETIIKEIDHNFILDNMTGCDPDSDGACRTI